MSDEGGVYVLLSRMDGLVVREVNSEASNTNNLAYTIFGERFEKFGVIPPIPEDYEFREMP
jgi:hypothetical protein